MLFWLPLSWTSFASYWISYEWKHTKCILLCHTLNFKWLICVLYRIFPPNLPIFFHSILILYYVSLLLLYFNLFNNFRVAYFIEPSIILYCVSRSCGADFCYLCPVISVFSLCDSNFWLQISLHQDRFSPGSPVQLEFGSVFILQHKDGVNSEPGYIWTLHRFRISTS